MIRWSYLAPRLIVLGLTWAFFYFCFDSLLERGVEYAGGRAIGAKVEIASLKTKFFPPSVTVEGFAAADPGAPMRNMVEFRSARFRLLGRPLLDKKFVVPEATLEGLVFGTERTTSGELPKAPPSASASKLEQWSAKSVDYLGGALGEAKTDVTGDYAVKAEDLASVRLTSEIEGRFAESSKAWDTRLASLNAAGRVAEIEKTFKTVQNEKNVLKKIKAAKSLADQVKALRSEIKEVKKSVQSDVDQARSSVNAVKAAKKKDLDAISAKMKLPSFDSERISAYLLGRKTASRISKTLRFVETARAKLPSKGQTKKAPARRGVTIEFPKERSWPSWWIQKLGLSGTVDLGGPVQLEGLANDFASVPSMVADPATIELSGKSEGRTVSVSASLDHRSEVAKDSIAFNLGGIAVKAFELGSPSSFGLKIGNGTAQIQGNVTFVGDAMSGRIKFRETGVSIEPTFGNVDKRLRSVLVDAFDGIRVLEVDVVLSGTLADPGIKIVSNLGKAAASGLKKSVGKKIAAKRRELQKKIDAIVDGHTKALRSKISGRQKQMLGKIGLSDKKLGALSEKIKKQTNLPIPKLPSIKKLF